VLLANFLFEKPVQGLLDKSGKALLTPLGRQLQEAASLFIGDLDRRSHGNSLDMHVCAGQARRVSDSVREETQAAEALSAALEQMEDQMGKERDA
jgi:hypothetical protein